MDIELVGGDLVLVDLFDSDMCSVDFLLDDFCLDVLYGVLKVFV